MKTQQCDYGIKVQCCTPVKKCCLALFADGISILRRVFEDEPGDGHEYVEMSEGEAKSLSIALQAIRDEVQMYGFGQGMPDFRDVLAFIDFPSDLLLTEFRNPKKPGRVCMNDNITYGIAACLEYAEWIIRRWASEIKN